MGSYILTNSRKHVWRVIVPSHQPKSTRYRLEHWSAEAVVSNTETPIIFFSSSSSPKICFPNLGFRQDVPSFSQQRQELWSENTGDVEWCGLSAYSSLSSMGSYLCLEIQYILKKWRVPLSPFFVMFQSFYAKIQPKIESHITQQSSSLPLKHQLGHIFFQEGVIYYHLCSQQWPKTTSWTHPSPRHDDSRVFNAIVYQNYKSANYS